MKSNLEVELLLEVIEFLNNIDEKAREKIYYNVRKSQLVSDKELFKKLNDLIWEFRTFYNGKSYRLFSFWDNTGKESTLVVNSWNNQKDTKNTSKGNKKSRRGKTTIF